MTDLDELVLTVRDTNSRAYINDAVHAYRDGLGRAAVILAWTAVAYDLISKYRELSDQGEPAAVQFTKDLDQAIQAGNAFQLQATENKLLELARDPFEIIDDHEKQSLDRLKLDRNLCAHPALTGDSVLFTPLPEQIRAHIVQAVKSVLQHPPVQGKAAFARLKVDLLQPSFPVAQEQVNVFLSQRYLRRLKQSLIATLAAILAKEVLLQPDSDLATVPQNVVRSLICIGQTYPQEYEAQMKQHLPRYAAAADDEKLRRLLLILSSDPRVWHWLDYPTQIRLSNLVQGTIRVDQLWSLSHAFRVPELSKVLKQRFDSMDDDNKEKFIAHCPAPELADEAIRIFGDSSAWRVAEARGKTLILPLAGSLTTDQVRALIKVVEENSQIWDAAEIPEIIQNVVSLTKQTLGSTRIDWMAFIQRIKLKRENAHWDHIEGWLSNRL